MRLKRKRSEWKFLLLFLLLAGMMLHSCTDEGIVDAPSWHQAIEQGDNAIMRAAKAMVEGTQGEMSMPDMVKTLGKAQTRAAGATPQTLAAGSFTIDWDAAQSLHEEDGTVLLVPIKMKQNIAIWRFSVVNNKRKAEQTPMHSVLYVKKFDSTGNIMGRVLSYAPSRQYIKRHPKYKNEMDWYNPDHTDYSGLLLVSSLDGTLFHGFNYENGHRQYTFRPNVKAHNHEHESTPVTRTAAIADSCQHNHATDNKIMTAQSTVFNMRIISSTSAISTYSLNNETSGQIYCSTCWKLVDDCECFILDYCKKCGILLDNCTCECDECGREKRNCICCILCNSFPCECNSGSGSGSGGSGSSGGSGGSGSGSNSGSGGGGGGGNGSGNESSQTPEPVQVGKQAITNAAEYSVNEMIRLYGNELACCNYGVQCAFKYLFNNSTELDNKMANDMVQYWLNSSNWLEIQLSEAQGYANNGYFTVAGWINPTGKSGHVVVIVPGEPYYSGEWGCYVPIAMDTGDEKRTTGQPLSESFAKNKKNSVRYFVYQQ